jgi:type I restriction enzyme S subunit
VNLSGELLSAFKIRLPSVAEQKEIADRITRIDSQVSIVRQQLAKLRSLKTALMQDLLTGRKRVTALLNPAAPPIRRVS